MLSSKKGGSQTVRVPTKTVPGEDIKGIIQKGKNKGKVVTVNDQNN